eukprot:8851607-Alexandrium_andersonii.AAC.1
MRSFTRASDAGARSGGPPEHPDGVPCPRGHARLEAHLRAAARGHRADRPRLLVQQHSVSYTHLRAHETSAHL